MAHALYDYDRRLAAASFIDHPKIGPWLRPEVEAEYGKITRVVDEKYTGQNPMLTLQTERGLLTLILNRTGTSIEEKTFSQGHQVPTEEERKNKPGWETLEELADKFMAEVHATGWMHRMDREDLIVRYRPGSGDTSFSLMVRVEYPKPLFINYGPVKGDIVVEGPKTYERADFRVGSVAEFRKVLDKGEAWLAKVEKDALHEREKAEAVKRKLEEQAKKRRKRRKSGASSRSRIARTRGLPAPGSWPSYRSMGGK